MLGDQRLGEGPQFVRDQDIGHGSVLHDAIGLVRWQGSSAKLRLIHEVLLGALSRIGAAKTEGAINTEQVFFKTAAVLGLGCALMLLSARLVWFHYYILIVPLALFMCRPSGEHIERYMKYRINRVLSCIAIMCFTPLPFLILPPTVLTQAVLINVGVTILVALGMYEMWALKRAQ